MGIIASKILAFVNSISSLLCYFLSLFSFSFAAEDAYFITFPPSARIMGMAGTFTAVANDLYAPFYNDAGLGFQDKISFGYSYGNYDPYYLFPYNQKRSDYWSVLIPLPFGIGNLALSNQFDKTKIYDGSPIQDDWSSKLSYSHRVVDYLSLGMGIQVISISPPQPVGYEYFPPRFNFNAFDFSLLYKKNRYGIGLALYNVGKNMKYTYDFGIGEMSISREIDAPLPSIIRLGLSNNIQLGLNNLITVIDFTKNFTKYWSNFFWISFGAEYSLNNKLFLRAGYFWDITSYSNRSGFAGGIGITLNDFASVDIGIANHAEFNVNEIRLSATIGFTTQDVIGK